ncbi:MAG: hypothetical protein AAB618_01150 [Patescibacteria group bacterium]
MVNVGSLSVADNKLFDLDTQAGITAVLLAVRASDLPPSHKNELRDLIFLYTNGGKDQSVRLSLEQKISTHGLIPVASKAPTPTVSKPEQPTIGSFRSAPSFAAPVVPVRVSVVEPVPASVARTVPVTPTLTQNPAPANESVVIPAVQMPKPDQQQYLERIREIKSSVNEKVGNPVNLVDINNAVGREYMGALLDAMKRINSGMSAEGAMRRLEVAYLAVEETIRNIPIPTPVVESIVSPTPIPQPQAVYVPPVPEPTPAPYVAPVLPPIYEPVAATPQYQPAPPVLHHEATVPPVVPTPNYAQPVATPTPTIHTPIPHTFSSLADMVLQSNAQSGLQTPLHTPAPIASGDPLLALEVEDGLSQLLSEWSIFKKSGIFGTGPKGREHPLYKKMAQLQIPLLLAGRFEGATEEVRQSLTDYMNGWRYEQGLIYEKGEVFEHYLRRVIRHILDQQTR